MVIFFLGKQKKTCGRCTGGLNPMKDFKGKGVVFREGMFQTRSNVEVFFLMKDDIEIHPDIYGCVRTYLPKNPTKKWTNDCNEPPKHQQKFANSKHAAFRFLHAAKDKRRKSSCFGSS